MRIAYAAAREIAEDAARRAPEEACGLLAGKGALISLAMPMRNAAANRDAQFALAPDEQLRGLKRIEALGLDWLGVYHSHPGSPPIPSPFDLAGAVDGSLLQLIVSLSQPKPRLKLWRVDGASAVPLELVYQDESDDTDAASDGGQWVMLAVALLAVLALLAIAIALLPPAP